MVKKLHKQPHTDRNKFNINFRKWVSTATGLLALFLSVTVYMQALPMVFVFSGGFMGIPSDATMNDVDSVIWLFTSFALMLVSVYGFIAWAKYLFGKFISNIAPIFQSKLKK